MKKKIPDNDSRMNTITDEPIDIQNTMKRLQNDKALIKLLLQSLIDGYPAQMKKFSDAIDNKDTESIQLQAHNLKGVAANLDAKYIYNLATELEEKGKAKDLSTVTETIDKIKDEFQRLEEFVKSWETSPDDS